MRFTKAGIFVLATLLILTACGSSPSSPAAAPMSTVPAATAGMQDRVSLNTPMPNASPEMEGGSTSEYALMSVGDTTLGVIGDAPDRIIIRNAVISVNADDALELYKSIAQLGESLGGYEFSYSLNNYSDYKLLNAVYKIPPQHLATLIDYITTNSEVIVNSLKSDDITDSFYDAEIRLDTKRRSLEQYYVLLHETTTVNEIIQIQRTIDNITEEIETLEGRLRMWQRLADMATITLTIRENEDEAANRREISWNTLSLDDMGYLIKSGFVSVLNTIISIVQWIIIAVVGYAPIWLLLALVVYLGFLLRRGLRKRRARANEQQEATRDTTV